MAFLTADDIVDQAFGRLGDVDANWPSARAFMYRRIGHRQRFLFARAAQLNPERFGACATANLSSGLADLTDIVAPVPTPELIQRVEVSGIGTSPYASGDEIHIVRPENATATFAPRAFLRDGVLIQVGTDLALVASIKVYYAKLSALITTSGATTVLELDQPWDTLLELDIVKYLLEKATGIAADVRAQQLTAFAAEEKDLVDAFEKHVISYGPIQSSFLPPRPNSRATG